MEQDAGNVGGPVRPDVGGSAGRDFRGHRAGGGRGGDLAGFVAATYLRASLRPGPHDTARHDRLFDRCKTGVDVPAGKNLLGAFHQPHLVVADLDVLGSLPPAQLAQAWPRR